MQKLRFFRSLVLAGVFLLAACVPSVNPLYTPETIVFEEGLLGVWKETPEAEDSWNFTRGKDKSYILVIQEKEASSKFSAHLVKLGETLFLDVCAGSDWTRSVPNDVLEKAKIGGMFQLSLIPGHLIMKVKVSKTLTVQMLKPGRLQEFLAADPKALMHALPEQDRLVITAPTDELQKFFKKHAETTSLWEDPGSLQKIQL